MTHELRIKVAALATAGFLAVTSVAGLGLRHEPRSAQPAQVAPAQTHGQVTSGEHESQED